MSESQGQDRLKPCPCGKTPHELNIGDAGQGGKWAWVNGDCCGEWNIEFRTGYHDLDSDECMELAITGWEDAPRSTRIEELEEALRESAGILESASRDYNNGIMSAAASRYTRILTTKEG